MPAWPERADAHAALLGACGHQWRDSGPTHGETLLRVTATETKNRFGSLCAHAKCQPVFVEKADPLDTVILSVEQYQALQVHHDKASRAAGKKALEAEYGGWIAAQNARFEMHGIPGAGRVMSGRHGEGPAAACAGARHRTFACEGPAATCGERGFASQRAGIGPRGGVVGNLVRTDRNGRFAAPKPVWRLRVCGCGQFRPATVSAA